MLPRLVVLSGAGISAESGIPTFRDFNGLWNNYRIEDVASPEGWRKNPQLVLDFYNMRRKDAQKAQPNRAHYVLAELQEDFDVTVVTQNVDDLHERAGSKNVIHLHGSLFKMRSSKDESLVFDIKEDIKLGDKCPLGSQLRPHIVWFGEAVPLIETAAEIVASADAFIVVGTSLQVYPAAGLIEETRDAIPKFVVDTKIPYISPRLGFNALEGKASEGMERVKDELRRIFAKQ
ncbi:SIR2 family NAD-dependent protein deacylase [Rhodoflexus caldus]|uniref:SIR2 family NAD-dependent protein deacylase n=1 Tax=Rhodoflexus caldus TaxID=2891236 RepID=UPI002029DE45|nr:NAD-dependent deacylase [Rhodoflexus caldus]